MFVVVLEFFFFYHDLIYRSNSRFKIYCRWSWQHCLLLNSSNASTYKTLYSTADSFAKPEQSVLKFYMLHGNISLGLNFTGKYYPELHNCSFFSKNKTAKIKLFFVTLKVYRYFLGEFTSLHYNTYWKHFEKRPSYRENAFTVFHETQINFYKV